MNDVCGLSTTVAPCCLDAALEYHALGLPIVLAKGKNPGAAMGADWHRHRFTEKEIGRRFREDAELNVGVILGPASGLIDLECDNEQADQSYLDLFSDCELPTPPTHLARRGRHRWFKYHRKLAQIATLPKFQDKDKGGAVVHFGALECRLGVGGTAAQSLLPPSTTNGYTRQWVEGLSFAECDVPDLPDVVVERIIAAAAKEFEIKHPPRDTEGRCLGGRPGDDFNARASWDDVFKDTGWAFVEQSGTVNYWRRPGKTDGWSASTGFCTSDRSGDLFYCFTSSAAPLEAATAYSKFAVYTMLHHGGDFSAAATALAAQGYGDHELNLWKPEGRTDTANSKRFVATFGRDARFCPPWKQWFAWDGRRWRIDDVRRVEDWAKHIGRQVWAEVASAATRTDDDDCGKLLAELTKWAKYTSSGKGIREMLGLARSAPEFVTLPAELDTHPMLLCCENGTVDLTTGRLREHRREDRLTKIVPAKFDDNTRAPTWERFISEVFNGDKELIAFIQRAAGYTLTGDTSERCLFFAWGNGKNGKSTLLSALQKMLGDHAVTLTIDLLTVSTNRSIPAEVVDLLGARMAVANETEDGSRIAESFLKSMTGGEDKQKGRRPYEQFVEFAPTHKLWICGNHKPRIRGTDDGVWDRIRLIPFTVRFENPDKSLPKKLAAERDGILRWCVEGALAWQKQGLGEPTVVREATARYRTECDTIRNFLAACCVTGSQFRVRAKEAYASFRTWAEASGEVAMSPTKFGLEMAERFRKHTSAGVWYLGVNLTGADDGET